MDPRSAVDRYFGVTSSGSTMGTEVRGGVAVFMAMVYIIVVNTVMMTGAGVDEDTAFSVTALLAALGSLAMGIYARYPAAMAPGMGLNAMVCYTAVGAMGFTWQESLFAVVLSGLLFLALSLSGVRKRVLDSIPSVLKKGMTAGIGCFIAFIGLQGSGLIAASDATLVSLGDLSEPSVLLALLCLVVTVALAARSRSAGVIAGMVLTAAVGVVIGILEIPSSVLATPQLPVAGEFLDGITDNVLSAEFAVVVATMAFVEFFDGSGTLLAMGQAAGMKDQEQDEGFRRALNVDAGMASLAGVVGCTPVTAYSESAVGIGAGARTGLMAVVVGVLFLLALFIAPVFEIFGFECVVGAMVVVGALMAAGLREVEWGDLPSSLTVLTTILMMVLTYSITSGLAFGTIMYCASMVGAGRGREVNKAMYVLAAVFIVYLVVYAISF